MSVSKVWLSLKWIRMFGEANTIHAIKVLINGKQQFDNKAPLASIEEETYQLKC